MPIRPRESLGRDVFESLQKFEWRFQTLQTDYNQLMEVREPQPGNTIGRHRYTVRTGLHEAERRLHHFLSGYYTFKSLTTTLAESSPDPEFCGRVKNRRDEFSQIGSSKIILGLRHYVQHHNILPLLIKISSFTHDGPWYVINKNELRADFEYREPQMIRDVGDYDDWFDYYYEDVDGICIYPFRTISQNWDAVEDLREDIYSLARNLLDEEIDEYVQQITELMDVREELREEHDSIDQVLSELGEMITPELRELLTPEIYDRVVDGDS